MCTCFVQWEIRIRGTPFPVASVFSISVPAEQDANWDASLRPSLWEASWRADEWPTFCNASRGRVKPQMRFSTTVTRSRNRGIVSTCARAASTWKAPLPSALFHNISIFSGMATSPSPFRPILAHRLAPFADAWSPPRFTPLLRAATAAGRIEGTLHLAMFRSVVRRNVMERLIKSPMENLFFSIVKLSE